MVELLVWFLTFLVVVEVLFGPNVRSGIIQLGRYTLFAYLAQMLIVRMGYIGILRIGVTASSYYVINMILSSVVLYCVVVLLDRIRRKCSRIDGIYRFVFQ